MGFLLPLLNKKLNKSYKVVEIGFIVTLCIEIIQLLTNRGIFEIDDIFNNTLGTLLGYNIISIVLLVYDKEMTSKKIKIITNIIPIFITIISFMVMIINYNRRELGYLSISNIENRNMKKIEIINSIPKLDDNNESLKIYKLHILTENEVENYAKQIFEKLEAEIDYSHQIQFDYFDTGFISTKGHILTIAYTGATFSLRTIQTIENNNELKGLNILINDKNEILQRLLEVGIEIPENYTYYADEKNNHHFIVELYNMEDYVIDGNVECKIYKNGNFVINNNLIKYEALNEKEIISEQEAYNTILQGKFYLENFNGDLEKIEIVSVLIKYMLDSKGYYQPVYAFDTYINNNTYKIYIPAIKE